MINQSKIDLLDYAKSMKEEKMNGTDRKSKNGKRLESTCRWAAAFILNKTKYYELLFFCITLHPQQSTMCP